MPPPARAAAALSTDAAAEPAFRSPAREPAKTASAAVAAHSHSTREPVEALRPALSRVAQALGAPEASASPQFADRRQSLAAAAPARREAPVPVPRSKDPPPRSSRSAARQIGDGIQIEIGRIHIELPPQARPAARPEPPPLKARPRGGPDQ